MSANLYQLFPGSDAFDTHKEYQLSMIQLSRFPWIKYPTVATWPKPWYETGMWQLYEYKLCPDGTLKWYFSVIDSGDGHAKTEVLKTHEEAILISIKRNEINLEELSKSNLPAQEKESYRLKSTKTIQAKSRLAMEEQLMLKEAIRRNHGVKRVSATDLYMDRLTENYRSLLANKLNLMPYLEVVLLRPENGRPAILEKQEKNSWSLAPFTRETAKIAHRSQIANGFNLSGADHWGKTKAAIRKMLLPRANQLLQLAGVKHMLSDAQARGQKVLVANGYVFWFEEDGQIGWQVKEVKSSEKTDGVTLWKEGTIISKNHGRLVILPYIKENGEHVKGHTRNAPGDGRAKPRHPDQYVELPYEVLKDDLMIGLFGELPYE